MIDTWRSLMKKLNSLALGCFILFSPLSLFAQKVETEIVKAFDGTSARCQTKSDYIRNMRSGAYNVQSVDAELSKEQKISLRITTQDLLCQHLGGESYAWKKVAPNVSFEYRDIIFRDSTATEVNVVVSKQNSRLAAISDDYQLLDEQKISSEVSGVNSAHIKFDLGQTLTRTQMARLEKGEEVKLRIGILKKAEVTRSIPGHVSQLISGTQNWGTFYIFLNVKKDQESLIVDIID